MGFQQKNTEERKWEIGSVLCELAHYRVRAASVSACSIQYTLYMQYDNDLHAASLCVFAILRNFSEC